MVDIDRGRLARHTGVSLALLGTVTGLAVAETRPEEINAVAAKSGNSIKNGTVVLADFKRGSLESRFYTHKQSDARYLKISDASKQYLKLDGLQRALTGFLKIDALSQYIKGEDAAKQYLKLDGAAADAHKLGGLDASRYVQGKASILVGQATTPSTFTGAVFLTVPGIASFASGHDDNGAPALVVQNTGDGSVRLAGHFANAVLIGLLLPGESRAYALDRAGGGVSDGTMQMLLPAVQKMTTVSVSVSEQGADKGDLTWLGQAVVGQ
jgi:hypothetical protein